MLAKYSVKKAYTVLVAVVMVIVLGIVAFTKMTTDLLPSINLPYVLIMTSYPGASPEMSEMVITAPLESSMATVSNIENVSSVSSENYSMVILEFAQSANMDSISLEVREKIDQIKTYWPEEVANPIIMKLNPDMMPIMIAALGVEGMSQAEISDYAKETVAPEIESIEGVASASITGLLEEKIHVVIRQDKIDKVNELVFGSIDKDLEEAEQDIIDGLAEIRDSRVELADGKQEIIDGYDELNENLVDLNEAKGELADGLEKLKDGKEELADGKEELKDQKDAVLGELADKYTELLKAKSDISEQRAVANATIDRVTPDLEGILVSGKILADLKTAYMPIMGIDALVESTDKLSAAGNWSDLTSEQVAALKANTIVQGIYGANPLLDLSTETAVQIRITLTAASDGMVLALSTSSIATVTTFTATEEDKLKELIVAEMTIPELDKAEDKVDAGIEGITKAQLEATSGFAVGEAGIVMGEANLESTESQLEASEEQLDSGIEQIDAGREQLEASEEQLADAVEQLNDAEEQLNDGKEQLDESREKAYNSADMEGILTVEMVGQLLTAQNFSMPAGYVTEEGIDYLIRVGDKPEDVDTLARMPIMNLDMEDISEIRLSDVADVFMTNNSDEIYTNVNGASGVLLNVQKQTGYSTGDVSDSINKKFDELAKDNKDLTFIVLNDQGVYIDLVMDSIFNNLIYGAILAIMVLLLFLRDVKPTIIIALAIPISLIAAIVCMYFTGITLNVISLSGLALGIGMLVDNSIVVIENIYRLRNEGYSKIEAAIAGTKEVGGAIVASTLTTICVFAPIIFVEGITRQLFVDMGLTIAYSLLASLLIALTVVPALSSRMLTKVKKVGVDKKENKFATKFFDGFEKFLATALKWKIVVFIIAIAILGVSIALAMSNGVAFMEDMDSNQFTVNIEMPKGTPLKETAAVTDEIIDIIKEIKDVEDIGAMANSDSAGMMGMGGNTVTNATTLYMTTIEDKSRTNDKIAAEIKEKTAHLEDAEITINTASMDMTAMTGSGINIMIKGRDIDTLQDLARDVAAKVSELDGVVDVSDGMTDTTEELRVIIDREKAMKHNIMVAQVFAQINAQLLEPKSSTILTTETKDFDVYVMRDQDITLTREEIKKITIEVEDKEGMKEDIPLSDIATFESKEGLSAINRDSQSRYIQVTAGIGEGYNIGFVAEEITETLEDYPVPRGYSITFDGENEMIMEAMGQMLLMLLLAIVFMYCIMVAQFQSLLSPFIIMFTLPLAFTGGFMGLYISGSEVSVISLIGFVMLAGIIVNNGIVIVDYMNQLQEDGYTKKEAILKASRVRMRPVFMTALTTILALSTMVFSKDMGAAMSKPMAIVTIGGLIYGTLLTLIVIPCIYDVMYRRKKVKE